MLKKQERKWDCPLGTVNETEHRIQVQKGEKPAFM